MLRVSVNQKHLHNFYMSLMQVILNLAENCYCRAALLYVCIQDMLLSVLFIIIRS